MNLPKSFSAIFCGSNENSALDQLNPSVPILCSCIKFQRITEPLKVSTQSATTISTFQGKFVHTGKFVHIGTYRYTV